MATRINKPVAEAERVLRLHREAYSRFWEWTRNSVETAFLTGQIETPLGWRMQVGDIRQGFQVDGGWANPGTSETTLQNWPMQATAGDILRVAAAAVVERGHRLVFPLHDALLVECDLAQVEDASRDVAACMEEAASVVLGGFRIPADVEVVRPGENLRGKQGHALWGEVSKHLALPVAAE